MYSDHIDDFGFDDGGFEQSRRKSKQPENALHLTDPIKTDLYKNLKGLTELLLRTIDSLDDVKVDRRTVLERLDPSFIVNRSRVGDLIKMPKYRMFFASTKPTPERLLLLSRYGSLRAARHFEEELRLLDSSMTTMSLYTPELLADLMNREANGGQPTHARTHESIYSKATNLIKAVTESVYHSGTSLSLTPGVLERQWVDKARLWRYVLKFSTSDRPAYIDPEMSAKGEALPGTGIVVNRAGVIDTKLGVLMPVSVVQMVYQLCVMRANVHAAISQEISPVPNLLSAFVMLTTWQLVALKKYGNAGYDLVKCFEALGRSRLSQLSGQLSSYNNMLDKYRQRERELERYDAGQPLMIDTIDAWFQSTSDARLVAEAFGFNKFAGSPVLDAYKSAEAAREVALQTLAPVGQYDGEAILKLLIIREYLKKTGQWPPFILPPTSEPLKSLYENRVSAFTPTTIPLSCLDDVVIGKIHEFDYCEDYMELLDDKACCVPEPSCAKLWYESSTDERRLLLAVLSKDIDTHEIILEGVEDRVPRSERVVGLREKHGEMKVKGRCFALLPIRRRLFFGITEHNLSTGVMSRWLPQQSMTDSEATLRGKLDSLVSDLSPGGESVVIEIDLSRWNLRWRTESVGPIARVLGHLYGDSRYFDTVHDHFNSSTIFLQDNDRPPQYTSEMSIGIVPEAGLVWRGHKGGFEGIAQKLWTICTIVMVNHALWELPVSFTLLGQGDNQVLRLRSTDPAYDIVANSDAILNQISTMCALYGEEVNPNECVLSDSVLTYSKVIYASGVFLPTSLKLASRVFARDLYAAAGMDDTVSSIGGTVTALVPHVVNHVAAYGYYLTREITEMCLESNTQFYYPEIASSLAKLVANASALLYYLTTPARFGGPPNVSMFSLAYRGSVDRLALDAAWMRALGRVDKQYVYLAELSLDLKASPVRLLYDPWAIPGLEPRHRVSAYKGLVRQAASAYTKNKQLSRLFSMGVDRFDRWLEECLLSMSPFSPELAAEVYGSSPSRVLLELLSRITSTRTAFRLLPNPSFVRSLMLADASSALSAFPNKFRRRITQSIPNVCLSAGSVYDWCVSARDLWKRVTTPVDIDSKAITTVTPYDGVISYTIDMPNSGCVAYVPSTYTVPPTNRGPWPPYFGSKTKAKVDSHGVRLTAVHGPLTRLTRLGELHNRLADSPSIGLLLKNVIGQMTSVDSEIIVNNSPTPYGGILAHRLDGYMKAAVRPSVDYTTPTHIGVSTDRALPNPALDYPVVMQELMCLILELARYGKHAHPEARFVSISISPLPIPSDVPVRVRSLKPTPQTGLTSEDTMMYVNDVGLTSTSGASVIDFETAAVGDAPLSSLLSNHATIMLMTGGLARRISGTRGVSAPSAKFDLSDVSMFTASQILTNFARALAVTWITMRPLGYLPKSLHTAAISKSVLPIAYELASVMSQFLSHDVFTSMTSPRLAPGPGRAGIESLTGKLTGRLVSMATRLLEDPLSIAPSWVFTSDNRSVNARIASVVSATHLMNPSEPTTGSEGLSRLLRKYLEVIKSVDLHSSVPIVVQIMSPNDMGEMVPTRRQVSIIPIPSFMALKSARSRNPNRTRSQLPREEVRVPLVYNWSRQEPVSGFNIDDGLMLATPRLEFRIMKKRVSPEIVFLTHLLNPSPTTLGRAAHVYEFLRKTVPAVASPSAILVGAGAGWALYSADCVRVTLVDMEAEIREVPQHFINVLPQAMYGSNINPRNVTLLARRLRTVSDVHMVVQQAASSADMSEAVIMIDLENYIQSREEWIAWFQSSRLPDHVTVIRCYTTRGLAAWVGSTFNVKLFVSRDCGQDVEITCVSNVNSDTVGTSSQEPRKCVLIDPEISLQPIYDLSLVECLSEIATESGLLVSTGSVEQIIDQVAHLRGYEEVQRGSLLLNTCKLYHSLKGMTTSELLIAVPTIVRGISETTMSTSRSMVTSLLPWMLARLHHDKVSRAMIKSEIEQKMTTSNAIC